GVFSLEDALRLIAARGRVMQDAPPGAMLAVSLAEPAVRPRLGTTLALAAVNGPEQCVVSGPLDDVAQFERQCAAEQIATSRLRTSHAFHSPLLTAAAQLFGEAVRRVSLQAPCLPYLSNVTGTWITPEQATDPAYWTEHLLRTVRFGAGLDELARDAGGI